MTLAIFLSGWLAGVLTVVLCLVIGLRLSGDRADQFGDDEPYGDVTVPPGFRFRGGESITHGSVSSDA